MSGSSVGLRWSGAPEVEDVKYLVQYQQNKGPPEWVYYRPSHPVNATEIIVEDLKPYTKYQVFRGPFLSVLFFCGLQGRVGWCMLLLSFTVVVVSLTICLCIYSFMFSFVYGWLEGISRGCFYSSIFFYNNCFLLNVIWMYISL